MKKKVVNSQLSNFKTYLNYRDKMMILAQNVFKYKDMPKFINMAVVNYNLVTTGSIAFFMDEVYGLMALPYVPLGEFDLYGRPTKIKVIPVMGVYNRTLVNTTDKTEFVIMYDNDAHISIYPNILASAERLALIKRTIDINIRQQQTPRFYKTSENNKKTLQDLVNEIEANVNTILTYDNIDVNDITCVLNPAPYVSDKLNQEKHEEYSEFLDLIGIANVSINKKERVLKDEILTSMGGTIASRYGRFESRKKALEEINDAFGIKIDVEFYDGLPTTIESVDEYLNKNEESEVVKDVME